jgi:uncharacterized membrane-anchored protein YhcB (DUF1043 family)
MEALIGVFVGAFLGALAMRIHVQEKVKQANRERWRRYAANKRARKAARG